MAPMVVRTIIIYILLNFSLRIMGKRQIGELDVGELVSTLLISEIAASPIDDTDIPLLNAIVPALLLLSFEIILSTVKNKSEKLKRRIEGEPVFLIYRGKLRQKALDENRLSVNELLSEMRCQGIGTISDVEYAIIEQNGSISFMKRNTGSFAHPIVIDGEYVKTTKKTLSETLDILKQKRISMDGVFLMTIDDDEKINIIIKEEK